MCYNRSIGERSLQLSKLISILLATQTRLTAHLPKKLRPYVASQSFAAKRGVTVIGPRGVGKTTLLLNAAKEQRIIYVSADHPSVSQFPLIEIAEAAFSESFDGIIVDEVHHADNWSSHVKAIYDSFPKHKVWISDSSSLLLRKGAADLSRRFPKLSVPYLSFREYLELKLNKSLDPFDPFHSPIEKFTRILSVTDVQKEFKEYLDHGLRPFFLEGDYKEKMLGIIEKSIYHDVPFFVPSIQENHLRLMNAVLGFLAESPIPTINIDDFAKRWSLGKEKLYQLLKVMEHVDLIKIVRYKSDKSVSGKGAKIFLSDPSVYAALQGNLGTAREAFTVCMFNQMGLEVFACKNEKAGDFILKNMVIEIGGRNKARKSSEIVIRDDIETPTRDSIPLWSLGMMY
jgi:uncharacterized protein